MLINYDECEKNRKALYTIEMGYIGGVIDIPPHLLVGNEFLILVGKLAAGEITPDQYTYLVQRQRQINLQRFREENKANEQKGGR